MRYRRAAAAALVAIVGLSLAGLSWGRFEIAWDGMKWHRHFKVEDRLAQFGDRAKARLAPHFAAAGVTFPPEEVALLAFKDARALQLYVRSAGQNWRFVRDYPVLGASGVLGPKLRGSATLDLDVITVTVRFGPTSPANSDARIGWDTFLADYVLEPPNEAGSRHALVASITTG